MKYNEEPGIVYDMLHFNIFYFSEKNMREVLAQYEDKEDSLFFYQKALLKEITPPQSFFPFFYYTHQTESILSSFVCKHFNHQSGTVQSLYTLIQDEEKFKRHIYFRFWEPLHDRLDLELFIKNDSETISNFLLYGMIPYEITKEIIQLFYHYDETIYELVKYLKNLEGKVRKLRQLNDDVIRVKQKSVNTERFETLVKRYCNMKDSVKISTLQYAICLISRHFCACFFDQTQEHFWFLFGIDSEQVIENCITFKNVKPEIVGRIFFNPAKSAILKALSAEEQTATQLSDKLSISRTSMTRHISELHAELFIKTSKRNKNEVYYTLNLPYIEAAERCLQEEFDNLLGEK